MTVETDSLFVSFWSLSIPKQYKNGIQTSYIQYVINKERSRSSKNYHTSIKQLFMSIYHLSTYKNENKSND